MKKRLTAVILAAALTVSASFTAFAGTWEYTGGYWYFSDPTVNYEDEFLTGWQWIDGYCYYLDPDEGGAMAVMTVTPDGYSVNELGRMMDMNGEPYYIPGWGLTSTTVGPADYIYDNVYLSDYQTPLSSIWDLDFLDGLWGWRDREPDEHRRRTPDTLIVQVEINGAHPENPEEQPEKTEEQSVETVEQSVEIAGAVSGSDEQPENKVITAGGGARHSETMGEHARRPAEVGTDSSEQTEDQVVRAGGTATNSETVSRETENGQRERPAGRPQGRSENGSAAGSRTRTDAMDPNLLFLLGVAEE